MLDKDGKSTEEIMAEIAAFVANELKAGHPQQQVATVLADKGWFTPADATAMVADVASLLEAERADLRWNVVVRLAIGVLFTTLGVGASWYTYSTAQPGETYFLYIGFIVVGVIQFGIGLSKMNDWSR